MANATNDTKQRLIDTALELIWKSSYGSVGVDDICKAADVKKGSFYHFFPSKIDLAVAAMEETLRNSTAALDDIFSASRPPVERFERYADHVYQMQKEVAEKYGHVCGCPCASLGCEMAGQDDAIRTKFEDITNRKKRYFESTVRDMVAEKLLPETTDAKIKAEEVYVYVMGQLMIARIQNNLEPMKRDMKQGLLQLIGLKGKSSQAA